MEVQELLPHWPGFQRLKLSEEGVKALKLCEEETDDLIVSFKKDSSNFTIKDEGGGVASFTAYPKKTLNPSTSDQFELGLTESSIPTNNTPPS